MTRNGGYLWGPALALSVLIACAEDTATGPTAGTGYDQVQGAATQWRTATAPVVPGETITLGLMVFDVQDQIYDTSVLLDNFRWTLQTNGPPQ